MTQPSSPPASPSAWSAPALPLRGAASLPERVDVLVIGGGVAGLSCALFLAEAGVEVRVLEASEALGRGASGRDHGLVQVGTTEPPESLLRALGEDKARRYIAHSLRSAELLRARLPLLREGGLRMAMMPRELEALELSVATSVALGLPAELWSAARVSEATGGEGLGPARYLPSDAQLNPLAALTALAELARGAGAEVHLGCPVAEVSATADGLRARVGDRQLSAELVIYAAGASLRGLDPWFTDTLFPVREQCLAFDAPGLRLSTGGSGQLGYLNLNQAEDGQLIVGGARWATPHMETGETDDSVVHAGITEKLTAFVRRSFPSLAEARPAAAWSRIQANSCDGLPLVGPLPGRSRAIACAGFCGQEWGLAMESARGVAHGVLTGSVQEIPPLLLPSRLV